MNLQQLRYAIDIERTGSITKSAESLFLAQPSLSTAIKELEAEIGVRIFNRTPKGMQVTTEGKEFLNYAKSIINQVDSLTYRYQAQRDNRLSLKLASVRSSRVSSLFCDLVNQLPKSRCIDVYLNETTHFEVIESVASGDSDLGRIHYPPLYRHYFANLVERKGLVLETLWYARNYILMSANHPLAGAQVISPEMLKEYTEVLHGDFETTAFPLSQVKKEAGIDCQSRNIYVYDRGTVMDVLSNCHDCYLWTVSTHPRMLQAYNLVAKPICGTEFYTVEALIYQSERKLSANAQWFRSALKEMQYNETDIYHDGLPDCVV